MTVACSTQNRETNNKRVCVVERGCVDTKKTSGIYNFFLLSGDGYLNIKTA